MDSALYNTLNRSWKSTAKIILGGELDGELKDYEKWLSEPMVPIIKRASAISNREVYCGVSDYLGNANFVSLDEIDFNKKFEPLNINEIKDIDSIIKAVGERFQYCGNVVLGNSKFVEKSSNIHNSFHVLNSNFVYDSEYIAYSSYTRGSKYLFSVVSDYGCSHLIRTFETHKQSRCFEAWKCYDSSDIYFSSCVQGSQDVLFSFNQKNKKHTIGNIELSKDKYLELKAKLLAEVRGDLTKDKRLPSLMEIVSSSAKLVKLPASLKFDSEDFFPDLNPVEDAFQKTTSILFGRQLCDFQSYGNWLTNHVPSVVECKSAASGKKMCMSNFNPCNFFPKDRLVDRDEYWKVGEITKLEPNDIGSFNSIKNSIGKIGFCNPNGRLGECKNLILTPLSNTSLNCYCCPIASFNEACAYSYWPRTSKYIFGSALVFDSSFCINSYYSMNLSRCFEVDGSSSCSDLYFSHNCENVRDSMFCFNAKNLNHAIGNSEFSTSDYKKLKASILEQIHDELETNKSISQDIFTIGKRGRKLWHDRLAGHA